MKLQAIQIHRPGCDLAAVVSATKGKEMSNISRQVREVREICLNDIDPRSGELVWKNGEANEAFLEALTSSQAWNELSERFDLSEENNLRILNDFLLSIPAPLILSKAESGLRKLLYAGGQTSRFGNLTPKTADEPSTTPIMDEPARDNRGHLLGDSQRKWQEYREYSESHPSRDCKNRARVDAGYASFVRTNLEREAQNTESTQFKIAGQQPGKPNVTGVTPELLAWANEYKRTSTDQVRKFRNPSVNPLGCAAYEANLNAAIAANLI